MSLRLHRAAHHAETHQRPPLPRQKSGDDGVKWPLAAGNPVGMPRRQAETGGAVLQTDAGSRNHDARAEPVKIALDERYHHAVLVGAGEIHRAAFAGHAVAGIAGAAHIDQRGARFEIARLQQPPRRELEGFGVGDVAVRVRKSQFHRLNLQVKKVRRIQFIAADFAVDLVLFDDSQHNQRRQSLAVGRNFVQFDLAATVGAI